jgi:phage-related minor tail protein
LSSVFRIAADLIRGAIDGVKMVVGSIAGFVAGAVAWIAGILSGPFNVAKDLITTAIDGVLMVVRGMQSAIAAAVRFIGDVISAPFEAAWRVVERIVGWILDAVDKVKGAFEKVGDIAGKVGGFAGNIIGLQHGGIVTKPTLAMIGERGPEAVIPLSRASQGGPWQITVNVSTTGLGTDTPAIQRAVVDAIRGYVGRNGPIAGIAG